MDVNTFDGQLSSSSAALLPQPMQGAKGKLREAAEKISRASSIKVDRPQNVNYH
jgi:hypothetical protein